MQAVTGRAAAPVTQTLEIMLSELSKFGRPFLWQRDNGTWVSTIDVNNSASQTTVSVKGSGQDAKDAAESLLKNVKSTVAAIGVMHE